MLFEHAAAIKRQESENADELKKQHARSKKEQRAAPLAATAIAAPVAAAVVAAPVAVVAAHGAAAPVRAEERTYSMAELFSLAACLRR